jgi:glycosyltransferase involved in cell wall biosynthesis
MLFARLAQHWEAVTGQMPEIVDYENGETTKYLEKNGVAHKRILRRKGDVTEFARDDSVLSNLISARMYGGVLKAQRTTRIMMWSTHPFDSFRWLPTYHAARLASHSAQRRFMKVFHPQYYKQLKAVFNCANERGGLFMMDQDTLNAIMSIFELETTIPKIPIFTDGAPFPRASVENRALRVCWVGRLEDFKTKVAIAIARDVNLIAKSGTEISLDVIGYGEDEKLVETEVASLNNPQLRCMGPLEFSAMNRHLATEVDVFCGHGTAILEAAKFGIPSLLADGFYFDLKAGELKYRWLHEDPVGNIGQMLHDKSELRGRTLAECLANPEEVRAAGEKSLARWREAHEPFAATKRIYECLQANTFTYGDLVDAGALDFDWHGGAFMAFKRWWTKNKY